jgi:hypothetical protein
MKTRLFISSWFKSWFWFKTCKPGEARRIEPHWMKRPSSPGMWILLWDGPDGEYSTILSLNEEEVEQCKECRCYGPIPPPPGKFDSIPPPPGKIDIPEIE